MNILYVNIIIFTLLIFIDSTYSFCALNVHREFGFYAPLLQDLTGKGFIYPQKPTLQTIVLQPHHNILANCPGSVITINRIPKNVPEIILTCIEGSKFRTPFGEHEFRNIRCASERSLIVSTKRTGQRCSSGHLIQIGYESITIPFTPKIDICYNQDTAGTFWAHHVLPSTISNNEGKKIRLVPFNSAEIPTGIDLNYAYTTAAQWRTIFNIMSKNKQLTDKYVGITGSERLVRSLLVARSDHFFFAHQNSSYFYLNVIPVWRSISLSNWQLIQAEVKKLAYLTNDLDVYTGGLYNLRLPFTETDTREIFLTKNKNTGLPSHFVPKLLFKLVFNSHKKRAIVFITINNPFLSIENIPEHYIICKPYKVCIVVHPGFHNTERGYTYCCLYEDFIEDKYVQKIGLPQLPRVGPLIF